MGSLILRAANHLKRVVRMCLSMLPGDRAKLYKTPIHLKDKELVQIMRLCFSQQFEVGPSINGAEVSLKVRRNLEDPLKVEFWFTVSAEKRYRNYTGFIAGFKNLLTLTLGVKVSDNPTDDWDRSFHIPIGLLKNYAEQICYFTRGTKVPEMNPIFTKDGWQEIYRYNYKTKLQINEKENFVPSN
jgi:hypothetical protein